LVVKDVVGLVGAWSEAANGLDGVESGVLSSAAASAKKLLLSKAAASMDRTRRFVFCILFSSFCLVIERSGWFI
jgi:hypothetical protein